MKEIIKVENLKKNFGEVKAVDDISFGVNEAELFGFLGVNGAGKSTTINMLCTLFKPTDGMIHISDYVVGKDDAKIRDLIGVVWQHNCLDIKLSVKENLMLRGALYGMSDKLIKAKIKELGRSLEMNDILDRRYGKLSGGQKRRAEIGAALMNTPKILFLDEPTTGLDPATRKNVWECINKMQQKTGMTVFLTTHYMEEAATANNIAIIDSGKIKEYGSPIYLKEKYASDILHLEAKPEYAEEIKAFGDKIPIKESLDALPILNRFENKLAGFEVIHGTMDDVFLKLTGKVCEKA